MDEKEAYGADEPLMSKPLTRKGSGRSYAVGMCLLLPHEYLFIFMLRRFTPIELSRLLKA